VPVCEPLGVLTRFACNMQKWV